MTISTQFSTGKAPPERPVPAPLATQGMELAIAYFDQLRHFLGSSRQYSHGGALAVAGEPVALSRQSILRGAVRPIFADYSLEFFNNGFPVRTVSMAIISEFNYGTKLSRI